MSAIAEAASVLLARGPGSAEVFVVRRAAALRFFGGFLAFPGGKVMRSDAELLPQGEHVRCVTAARELFEEAGILLARRADGSFPPSSPQMTELRREMVEGRLSFGDILTQLDLTVRADDFTPIGALTTPPYTPLRFDTTFFVAEAPPEQHAEVWPGELDHGAWATAADLFDQWVRGEVLISPPTLFLLEAIRGRPVGHVANVPLPSVDPDVARPILFSPGVHLLSLRTMALPPSTHTNAYLVGTGPTYLLDPGASDPAEQQALFNILDARRAAGQALTAVVLTHHHPDHVGAAAACAQRYGIPVWAHPLTARALKDRVPIAHKIQDGDRLPLGMAPDGRAPWHLEAIHTPGHAPGHLSFFEPHYRLLFVGDMVSTLSSVIVAPPDGDLAVYIASLRRLRGYDCRLLLPGHGSPTARPAFTLDECIAHRVKREEQLLHALGATPRTIPDLAVELYKGLPAPLMRWAELQLLAGLQKLEREGRAELVRGAGEPGWRLRETA